MVYQPNDMPADRKKTKFLIAVTKLHRINRNEKKKRQKSAVVHTFYFVWNEFMIPSFSIVHFLE